MTSLSSKRRSSMSRASLTSSPTLIGHGERFEDTTHRSGFHYIDTSDRFDFSQPPAALLPPPYPESVLFSDDDYDSDHEDHHQHSFRGETSAELQQRAATPTNASMRKPGLQLLYTHIAHGAIHGAVVERFNPPACHPETHLAIVDDVMSWIQYMPPPAAASAPEPPPTPSSPGLSCTSATYAFYGPHAKHNRARSTQNKTPQPAQPEYILWLMGPMSCGKSSLMQTIAERCLNTHVPSDTPGGPPLPLLAASFFFRHYRALRNCKSQFITTLVHQLTKSVPGLGEIVEKVIERDVGLLSLAVDRTGMGISGSGGGRTSGLVTQMEKLLIEPLSQLASTQLRHHPPRSDQSTTPKSAPRVILIEALDECINDEDQLEVLSVIRRLSQDRRFTAYFRLVVSSKPHRTIERQFKLHPEMDLATYRLTLPFPEESALEKAARSGSGRRRGKGVGFAGELGENVEKDLKRERDIRLYLECKFNEICRSWYGLPRNVAWLNEFEDDNDAGTSIRSSRHGGTVIDKVVYNTAGKFPYALTVVRFIMQGNPRSDLSPAAAESKDSPKRLLDLVLKAKFTKSYREPMAALDALYGVIVNEAAERAGFKEVSHLARVIRNLDELLSTGHGLELTLPRLALFFGFGPAAKNKDETEARCIENAFVGGLLNAVLEVPVPIEEGESAFAIFRKAKMKESSTVRRVVKFHDREFVEFLRDPKRSKGLYVSRSQLYTDLAVRYLRSASAQHSLQPSGGRITKFTHPPKNSGRLLVGKAVDHSVASSTSSFSATFEATDDHETPRHIFSAPAEYSTFRRNHPYPSLSASQSPYAIDADDASLFFSQLHLGKFCSFAVADHPALLKELAEFDVDLWLFGISAAAELDFGPSSAPPMASQAMSLGGRRYHRRVLSEMPPIRSNANVDDHPTPDQERERERKRNEALAKLHSNTSPSPGGPENDVDAMYRWVHVECSWSSCTPVCKRWRRAIVKFWHSQGAPQQPSVMDRIYDRFISRDVKRVQLITTRYRL